MNNLKNNVHLIGDYIAHWAEITPNRVAVKWVGAEGCITKTYSQFYQDILVCADEYFSEYEHQRIAICGKQDYRFLILLMAILCSHNSAVLVTDFVNNDENKELLKNIHTAAYVVYDGNDFLVQAGEKDASLYAEKKGNDVEAVVLLTSGTTGRKKCVSLSHKNLLANAHAITKILLPATWDVDLQVYGFLPFCHAFALQANLFCPIYVGETICLGSGPAQFIKELFALKPTFFIAVPQIIDGIMGYLKANHIEKVEQFPVVFCGGARLDPTLIEKMRNYGIIVLQGYGTTECSPIIAVNPINANNPQASGKVLEGIQVRIRDEEILVKGDNVFTGYVGDEESTKQVFEDGYYKTGDKGWIDENGYLYVTGRLKTTIVLPTGENIAPEDIEDKLMLCPAIEDAYVYERKNGSMECIAAAIYSNASWEEVRLQVEEVNQMLEVYEKIQHIELTTEPLLRTELGKIRRIQNYQVKLKGGSTQVYVAPKTELEKDLAEIFASVLELEQVGVNYNFFEIGGHSLRAVRLANEIENVLQYKLKVQEIFAHPTVGDLAEYLETNGTKEHFDEDQIPKAERKPYYPMSSSQKRMYLNYLMDKNSLAYNLSFSFTVKGKLDSEKLERNLNEIIKNRSAFRTRFFMHGEEFVQEIVEDCRLKLEVNDTAEGFVRPFDLYETPQLRVRYVQNESGNGSESESVQLLFDIPHIVSDGATITQFMKELVGLYNEGEIEPERLSYVDYSEWMANRDLSDQRRFWLDLYEDKPEPLNLTTDYPRPKERSQRGSSVFRLLKKEQFRDFASTHQMTDYMLFLSGIMILMGKYGNAEDVVIGSPINGRTTKDAEKIYGMFVNTLALRGYPAADKSINAFLKEIMDMCILAYDHQEYPFEELVDELKVGGDRSRNPLFDVMFVLQNNEKAFNTEENTAYFKDVVLYKNQEKRHGSKFDLSFAINELADDYEVELEYSSDLFCEETAERILEHLETVLNSMMRQPESKIADIEVASSKEREYILANFAGEVTDTKEETIISLLQKAVIENPDKIALREDKKAITYRELNDLTNCYANEFLAQGVVSGDCIAIVGERCIKMVTCCYAALKCGASYVMIDDLLPEERKEKIIQDAAPKLVVRAFSEDDTVLGDGADACEPQCSVSPDMPAYLIYTSGTGGQPKGVVCKHRGVVNLILWLMKEHPMTENAKVLEKTNLSFVDSVYEMFWPLSAGKELVILPQGDEMYPDRLVNTIRKYQITNIILVPTVLNELLTIGASGDALDSLRLIILSGEPLKESTVKQAQHVLNPSCCLLNQYGQSEGGFSSTHFEIAMDDEINPAYSVMPIGRSIQNVTHYIVKGRQLCGIGILGEICIGAEGLSLGYVNDEKMTEAKFEENPFGSGRLCHTGDYGKYLADGTIVCLGRMDNQIKIRGQRIELGEIENAIRATEKVRDCAVTAIQLKENDTDKSIVAYLVLKPDTTLEEIRNQIKQKLPVYMVPTAFVEMEAIPHTRNGKLDKSALPQPETVKEAEYVQPVTETECLLCEMFETVLGVEQVGTQDDFFLCGGHSLKASYLCNQIMDAFLVTVEVRDIFSYSTPKQLAEYIETLPKIVRESIPAAKKKETYPLTPVQRQFYMGSIQAPESLAFSMSFEMKLSGDVDVDRLKESFRKLVDHHSALRLSFEIRDGVACQILHDHVDFEMEVTENELAGFHRPFDLTKAPLIHARYVKNQSVLMFDIHHTICDGASTHLLMKDLSDLYSGKTLEAEKVSFIDYTEWMNQKDLSSQKEFWNQMYRDEIPVLNIPTDRPRGSVRSNNGNTIRGHLNKEKIHAFVKQKGISEYMLLLAAIMITLGKYGNTDDIVIGSPNNGRVHRDIEKLPGIFINNMALRGKPAPQKRIEEFLSEIKSLCLEAFANREYPLVSLVEDLGIKLDASRSPLFDVAFILQNNESDESQKESDSNMADKHLIISEFESKRSGSKYDMIFEIIDRDGYKINYEYNTDLYDPETAERILGLFEKIVDEITGDEYEKIKDLSNGLPEDICYLTQNYGKGEIPAGIEDSIISRFEQYVNRTPDKVVCIEGEQEITYREFYNLARRHAHILRGLGIKEGDIIPIIGGRNLHYAISVYGILMSGAAFTAVEISLPEERRNMILEEVKAKYYFENGELFEISGEQISQKKCMELAEKQEELPVLTSETIAYIQFTSGTDGKPKGVRIPHRGPILLTTHAKEKHKLRDTDVFLMSANLSYITSVSQLFYGTLTGGTLVILKQGYESNVKEIIRCVDQYKVTGMTVVPTILNLMIEELADKNTKNRLLPSLTLIECGGEPMTPFVAGRALDFFGPDVRIINVYGQTETAQIRVCYHRLTKEDVKHNRIPLGKPFEYSSVYLVKDDSLCGVGVIGEICVGGLGLSGGYLDEKLSAQKFRKLLLPNTGEEVLVYHTGDLAFWNKDGLLIGMGRSDHQVKIHGQRLELNDVNNAVRSLPAVEDSIVVARKSNMNEPMLCAYIVCREENFNAQEIRYQLSEKLPRYMIPASIMRLDKMPVTVNGKVDTRSLPEPILVSEELYTAPTNKYEAVICRCMERILKQERVGIKDNFFDIGGDSISAISLCILLGKEEILKDKRQLNMSDIMVMQTPEQIALLYTSSKEICFIKKFLYMDEQVADENIVNELLSYREQNSFEKKLHRPDVVNRLFLWQKENTVRVKVALQKVGSLDERKELIAKAIYGSVFEYAFDPGKGCYVQNMGIRSQILCYDMSELEGDMLASVVRTKTYEYDGNHLLSDIFLVSSEKNEYDYLYYVIQHSLHDRMSTVALMERINLIYFGQEDVLEKTEQENSVHTASEVDEELYDQYRKLAITLQNILQDLPYTRMALEQELSEEAKTDPIREIVKLYLKNNPALNEMEQIPIVVINSGRNTDNRYVIGCCLKMDCQIYDRKTETLIDVPVYDEEEMLTSGLNCVPLINYIGALGDAGPEKLTKIAKGFEKAKYLHGNLYENTLVLKAPVYHVCETE